MRVAAACLMGWAATTNYTNHAAVLPLLMAELGFGPVQAGLLSTAFFVTLAVACVPAGLLIDRLGPTGVGTAGLLAVFASNLALGYARDFPDLLLIKVAGGFGCALAFIAGMRYAALVVPPARVPRALGLYGGFVQLGGGTSLYLIPLLASRLGWRCRRWPGSRWLRGFARPSPPRRSPRPCAARRCGRWGWCTPPPSGWRC
jgi:MFS family permease